MKSLAFLVLASALALAACGGDDTGDGTTDSAAIDAPVTPGADARPGADAPPGVDAPPATSRVEEVTCPATPDATIMTGPGLTFTPGNTMISVNAVVKFVIGSTHNLRPQAPTTDAALTAAGGATKCLKFTVADTYHYQCTIHGGMAGTVTVN